MNELKQEIKSRLLEKLDHSMEMEDEAVQELVENEVWLMGKETYIPLAEKKRLCREIYYAIRKYDVLQELLEDETVTEIMVNGPDHIFIEKEGRLQQWQTAFESEDKLLDVIQQIVAKANRVVNESSPIVEPCPCRTAACCTQWADPDDPPLWKNTAAHTGAFKTWFCFTGDLYFFGKACHCGL